jgi:hypothetical protein
VNEILSLVPAIRLMDRVWIVNCPRHKLKHFRFLLMNEKERRLIALIYEHQVFLLREER